MSETVLKLLASELIFIRIVCPNKECGAIMEFSLASIPPNFSGHSCPLCHQDFIPSGADRTAKHIHSLATALQGIVGLQDKVRIEIVVPGVQDRLK